VSPDGNFISGGDADAFGLFAGVCTELPGTVVTSPGAGYGASNFAGLYYQAGFDEIVSGSGGTVTISPPGIRGIPPVFQKG